MDEHETAAVREFILKVQDTSDPAGTQARLLTAAPTYWRRDPEELLKRVAALERGLLGGQ